MNFSKMFNAYYDASMTHFEVGQACEVKPPGNVARFARGEASPYTNTGVRILRFLGAPEEVCEEWVLEKEDAPILADIPTIGDTKKFKDLFQGGDWPDVRLDPEQPNWKYTKRELKGYESREVEDLAERVRMARPWRCRVCGLQHYTKRERYECCIVPIREARAVAPKGTIYQQVEALIEQGVQLNGLSRYLNAKIPMRVLRRAYFYFSRKIQERENITPGEWRVWQTHQRMEARR